MSARYSPGSAYAFVGGDTTVIVSTADSAARDAIWPLVAAGAPIQLLAAALLTHAGAIADFVCVRRDATALTALIRGSFRVRLGDGSELDGAMAATWREWSVPLSWPVDILTGADSTQENLPLAAGVVRAGHVTLLESGESSTSTEPQVDEDAVPAAPAASAQEEPVIREPEPVDEAVSGPPQPVQPRPENPAAAPEARRKYDHHYEDSISADALEAVVAASSATPVLTGPPSAPSGETPAEPPAGVQQAGPTGFIQAVPDFSQIRGQAPAAGAASSVPAAAAAVHRVRLPTGETVELDRPTIFGREPAPPPGREHSTPDLIALANPQKDISGSHVELRPEGEHILAIDLSRYGTYLQMPGTEPVRLPAGKPFPLAPGARLHLNGTLAIDYVGMS